MKKRFLIIASIMFLAIMIPLTTKAATISAEPTEMKVGDIVTISIEVNTTNAKAVQFDLEFDNTTYEYVPDSAKSELDSTGSNLLDDKTVRVAGFNFNSNNTATLVTLQFTAKNTGKKYTI